MKDESKSNHHEWVMTIATGVMAVATIVMMYTGCQQTKIAASLEDIAKKEQEAKTLLAKRELQRAGWAVIEQMSGRFKNQLKTKEDCIASAHVICERMDIVDNYFLIQKPKQLQDWLNVRQIFSWYAIPNYFDINVPTLRGTNWYNSVELTDKQVVEMFKEDCQTALPKFMDCYSALKLGEILSAYRK